MKFAIINAPLLGNKFFAIDFRFKNRPNMSFDDARATPDQEFDLQPDYKGELEYNTKYESTFISYCM